MGGHKSIMENLLQNGALLSESKGVLDVCVSNGSDDILEMILSREEDLQFADESKAVGSACERGEVSVVETLLSHGRPPCPASLHRAVEAGQVQVVSLLLQHGADVAGLDSGGKSPLHFAILKDRAASQEELAPYAEIIELLIQSGANPDSGSPLHKASYWGHLDLARQLVGPGADVNLQDGKGLTPLHEGCRGGHEGLVEFLLNNGANIDGTDDRGYTPLMVAVSTTDKAFAQSKLRSKFGKCDNFSVVKLLVSRGAALDTRACDGQTALHLAVSRQHREQLVCLVRAGARLNISCHRGTTPLTRDQGWGTNICSRLDQDLYRILVEFLVCCLKLSKPRIKMR